MRVAVVGAGIGGLVAALDLREAGCDVVVLEGADPVGGKLRGDDVGDLRVDVGAESMLARRPEAVDL
uniref:NAD(P)-binding protein n=1 Tax=Aeromicrobium sp. TaxID=1871063 RepID=UPI003510ECC6